MWKELTEYIIPLRLYVWFLTASSQIMEPNDEEAEPGMMSFPYTLRADSFLQVPVG